METITVAGGDAIRELERLRQDSPTTGLVPILFGNADSFETATEFLADTGDPSVLLQKTREINVAAWLIDKGDEYADFLQDRDGEWPTETFEEMGIVTHLQTLTRKPYDQVIIGLLRIDAPWQAFTHLNWGGWNDCPSSIEHGALHRHWQGEWGAEVVSITDSVVQCIVSRPPSNRDAALRLAREQYAYCYDIVEQGTGSIAALAAGLVDSNYWYFWWD